MIDVLLIYLPVQYGCGHSFGPPPLGVFCLGSYLQEAGLTARVLDASIKGLSLEETVKAVDEASPRLIGISCLTPHLRSLALLLEQLHAKGYKGKIVCGGPHFDSTHDELMRYSDLDYILYGEGEYAFKEFVLRFLNNQPVETCPNLIWRQNGKVITNPPLPSIDDLDSLPFPDLSLGDPDDYEVTYGRYKKITSIMTSRGCPYLCTFCDVMTVWGRTVRQRSPERIVAEVEFNLNKFGIREFAFQDSTFTLNHKWCNRFLDEMEKRKLDVVWYCNTRIDRVNRDLLARMKKLGCTNIVYGIESGNPEVLKTIKKNIDVNQVEEIFRLTDEIGIQATANFMIGNPGENLETARQSLSLALKIPATYIYVTPVIAYPGTESYEIAVREGYLKDPLWYLRNVDMGKQFLTVSGGVSPGQLCLPEFPPEEQVAFAKKFWRKFYFRPSAIYRVLLRHPNLTTLKRALTFLPTFLRFTFSR